MKKRIFAGSLMGLSKDRRYLLDANPFYRILLDEPVSIDRLNDALINALKICPYMNLNVVDDEGIFLALDESERGLKVQTEETEFINTAANNGHSAAVFCQGNMITVAVTHALTDGNGIRWFVETLMDHYFGEGDVNYRLSDEPDYGLEPMEKRVSVSKDYLPPELPAGDILTFTETENSDAREFFSLKTSYADVKKLCSTWDCSVQKVLNILGTRAITKLCPDSEKMISVRSPIDARTFFQMPHTFQNSSIANMRFIYTPDEINGDESTIIKKTDEYMNSQFDINNISTQMNNWRDVLFAESHEEMLKRIGRVMEADTILISNLGKWTPKEYVKHIKGVLPGASMFPLMIYGLRVGDDYYYSVYDGTGVKNGDISYKNALKNVIERSVGSVNEIDFSSDKAV
ncbi:MAG: hypothetical protein K5639_00655 [Eubacterium sp.]|nr:hypothetical protein [Eubacterium sp.]